MTARSAVDAPVTMLRVYCTWPGASASWKRRRDARRRDLADDLVDRLRVGDDSAGARHVADGAEANGRRERILALHPLDMVGGRVEHAVAPEHLALVREVDDGQLELLALDVL